MTFSSHPQLLLQASYCGQLFCSGTFPPLMEVLESLREFGREERLVGGGAANHVRNMTQKWGGGSDAAGNGFWARQMSAFQIRLGNEIW